MGSSLSNAARRALGITAATFSLFAMAVGLSGCPVAADLEAPERFDALAGSTGGTGTTGGTSGGGAGPDCARPLPDPTTFACNWKAALGGPGQSPAGYCSKSGCHNATTMGGSLDLTPDDRLISRLLNKKPAHKISCGAGVSCDPAAMPPTCEKCAMCPAPGPSDVLLSHEMPGTGWMFEKLEQFVPGTTTTTMDIGCGDAMPTYNTTGSASYTQAHKDCLKLFFTEISKTAGTWPCGDAGAGGGGGAGTAGGGAGGAPTAGAGGT
jgi:hypothetical protein